MISQPPNLMSLSQILTLRSNGMTYGSNLFYQIQNSVLFILVHKILSSIKIRTFPAHSSGGPLTHLVLYLGLKPA